MDLQEKLNEIDKKIQTYSDTIDSHKASIKELKKQRVLIEKAKALEQK